MKKYRWFIVAGYALLLSFFAFAQTAPPDASCDDNKLSKIIDLSGLNTQILQIADTIANRDEIKQYLDTLPENDQAALRKTITIAFDGNALLETIQHVMCQILSAKEIEALLAWYTSEEGKAMTALEEIPNEREDWNEIYRSKKDPRPDAKRLRLYKAMLETIRFTHYATLEQIELQRMLLALTQPNLKGEEIERYLNKKRKTMTKELYEAALLNLQRNFASLSEESLERYLLFLSSPEAKAYENAKSAGVKRAIAFAADKVIAKAETLTKRPSVDLSPLHPKSGKLQDAKEACQNGDMQACFDLGFAYYKARGVKRDYAVARALIEQSCQEGIAKGCSVLGDMYYLGRGVKRNLTRAADYYEQSCKGGDMLGCGGIGILYASGYGVPGDYQKAHFYYEKACNGGNEMACRNLAGLYRFGHGVPRNDQKARELYLKACDGGNMFSCYIAGLYFRDGVGVVQDLDRAKALFMTGCKKRYAPACDMIGMLYLRGRGTAQDIPKAIRYFEKSCSIPNSRNGFGCYNLGMIYTNGYGVPKDIEKGKKYFRKGCDLGYKEACNQP